MPAQPVKQKTCAQCGKLFPISMFTNYAQSSDGKHSWCRDCKQKKACLYNARPDEQQKIRARNLKRNYGITPQDYDRLYESQKGMCFLCGRAGKRTGLREGLAVDHNHQTGKIRGLLCNTCNRALGLFREDVTVLQRAVRYLDFHRGKS